MSLSNQNPGAKYLNSVNKGSQFSTDVYSFLDDMFFEEESERVVFLDDKYMGKAVSFFLDEMNFMFYGGDETHSCIHVNLEKGTYQFVDHMDSKSKYEIPYDWVSFQTEIRDWVSSNPIVRRHSDVKNLSEYTEPVEKNTELISGAKEYLENFRSLHPDVIITNAQAMEMAQSYIDRQVHNKNKTTYSAQGNPEVKLVSGRYKHLEGLIKANGWAQTFEDTFGMTVRSYLNRNDSDKLEVEVLSDMGFEYLLDKINVREGKHWTRRKVEVMYDGQEDESSIEFEESDLPDLSKPSIEEE